MANDSERQDFVDNDEGLYDMQRAASNKRAWLRANREMIDEVAGNVPCGRKPAHYLKYARPLF